MQVPKAQQVSVEADTAPTCEWSVRRNSLCPGEAAQPQTRAEGAAEAEVGVSGECRAGQGQSGDCGHDTPDRRTGPRESGTPVASWACAQGLGVLGHIPRRRCVTWQIPSGGAVLKMGECPLALESLGQLLITPVLFRFE